MVDDAKIKNWLRDLEEDKLMKEADAKELCEIAKDILVEESNVHLVPTPVTVCGDIHGQFWDLLNLFKTSEKKDKLEGNIEKSYVFMGDYVDRGYNSVETFEYLLCLKILRSEKITLLRGNHESRQISQTYGFYDEINKRYGNTLLWKYFCDVFDLLPIAALVDGKILCIHGGLSPTALTVDHIRLIERYQEIPSDGPLSDFMWSDPDDSISNWTRNERGAGWLFGSTATFNFNYRNNLDRICRSHQLVQTGYQEYFKLKEEGKDDKEKKEECKLCTIWSAPNYCYRCGNKASIAEINDNREFNIIYFDTDERSKKSENYRNVLPYFL